MNKRLLMFLLAILLLVSGCTRPNPPQPPAPLPESFPSISRHPAPWKWNQGTVDKIDAYDPDSKNPWQLDYRASNLAGLDLSDSSEEMLHATFDDGTVWPAADKLPQGFDPQAIMQTGKTPGLGVRSLHEQGITGKGIGIAIIDQTLPVDHQEYINQIQLYEEAPEVTGGWMEVQMHGAAVASIAVGKTIGVAPEADLYFIASSFCGSGGSDSLDFTCLARNIRRIIEVNQSLPEERKIRVLSISVGWGPDSLGYDDVTLAVKEAGEAGIFVVTSSLEETHGFKFHGLGRDPLSDPDVFESYLPGSWWADGFDGSMTDRLLVPMDSRTTASPGGVDEYVFYRSGGWSWAIPYIAGMYALAAQVEPDITPDAFWQAAMQTGRSVPVETTLGTVQMGPILDPVALIAELQKP